MDEKGYEITGSNVEDTERKHESPYELADSDLNSINEIKRRIRKSAYTSREQINQHLLYLEHLENKLSAILSGEQRKGVINEFLNETLRHVASLFKELELLLDKFPEKDEDQSGPANTGKRSKSDMKNQGHATSGGSFQGESLSE